MQKAFQIGFLAENGQRISFLLNLSRQKQCEEPGTEKNDAFLFPCAENAPQLLYLSETGNRFFHGADLYRVADLPDAAFLLARCFTAHGEDKREGRNFLVKLQGLFEVPRRRGTQRSTMLSISSLEILLTL